MSDLLNSASLVMIPSGYKEDVVYSQIPTDGSGDLSFTRASNGTRVNSAGLVEVVPWNLAQQSETFDNAAWVKGGGLSVSTNTTTAPNGTTTADTLDDQNSGAYGNIEQNFVFVAGGYTFSIYIKKTSGSLTHYPGLEMCSKGTYLIFNTTTGAYVESGGTNYTVNVENVGDYWRVSITANTSGGTQIIGVWPAISSNGTSISHSATGSNVFWGAQLNIGSTAKPYFPTTDRLNVPRLTYQNGGGGCPSLLLEKQSTNLVSYSEQFDNAAWIKLNGSVTANTSISPDGTQNADSFIPNTTSGVHVLRSNLFNQSATAAHSWFVKANGYTKIAVRESELVGNYATFNLSTGTLISTNQTASIENLGNGWYRCTLVDTTTGANAQTSVVVLPDSYTSGDPIVVNWSGDGTKGVFAWGAQVEISSYPTSYIPTTSSSATRVADTCSKTGISSLIGTNFTIFFDGYGSIGGNSSRYLILKGSGGTYVNAVFFESTSNKEVAVTVLDSSGNSVFGPISTALTSGQRLKFALRCKNNDFAFYMNGVFQSALASGTVPTTSDLYLGYYTDYQDNYNKVNQVAIFNTGLTNAELASLTTI